MKQIRLSGREAAVVRAIGFSLAVKGDELLEITRLVPADLVDVLNGMMDVGYVECHPYAEHTTVETFADTEFEVNSAYTHEIKSALGFGRK